MTDPKVIQVGPVDPTKETSPIVTEETPGDAATRANCMFNSGAYAPGAKICSGGRLLTCQSNGTWWDVGRC